MAPDLYYLVRRGTNVRVCAKDSEPVLIERDYLAEQRDAYTRLTGATLDAMTITEWHDRYRKPVNRARVQAAISVQQETEEERV